jgi:hypothetical protein
MKEWKELRKTTNKDKKNASKYLENFYYPAIKLKKFTINPLWILEAKLCYSSLTFVACHLDRILQTIACTFRFPGQVCDVTNNVRSIQKCLAYSCS